jgi:hypothetical protein
MLLSTIGAQSIFTAILGGVIKAIGIEAAGITCFILFIIASSIVAVLIGLGGGAPRRAISGSYLALAGFYPYQSCPLHILM